MKQILLFSIAILMTTFGFAQPWNAPSGSGSTTITLLDETSGSFYDSGGSAGSYAPSDEGTIKFCPTDPVNYNISISFSSFDQRFSY